MTAPDRIIATILGCGSSGGVPRVGNDWGACDPNEPRNRRRRCSLLVEGWLDGVEEPTRVLIDTGCDLRQQLLDAEVGRVDAVLYTHEHADHTHGIDDLRVLALRNRRRVDVYFSPSCGARLKEAFGYCFSTPAGSAYPPILNAHEIEDGDIVTVAGPGGVLELQAFDQVHGDINALGFRVGGLAYSCDLSAVPESAHAALADLDIWIVDALRPTPHPSHLSLPETLSLIERFRPRQAVLTNMHIDLDYAATDAETPGNVTPAFDGMRIDIVAGRILNR
ncbi:MAG: phosphoribosyl 1,2-cyclic phosphodiesterase [Pelagibacterium sp. SCN 63-23]|nr:MAG: phosphoribosyl 1,2-cyclic phosphodiesterase [Pelagibacterium sp. SCN 63-23]